VIIPLLEQHRDQLSALCRQYGVRRLDVFGSAANGRFDPARSDLDFLVEFNDFTYHNAADRYFDFKFAPSQRQRKKTGSRRAAQRTGR